MATLPEVCFTCGKPLLWEEYRSKIKNKNKDEVLDEMGYSRECCRRMLLSDVPDYEETLLLYPSKRSGSAKIKLNK
jgi:DNA-directed RNA polymerase subunit N (RpoN/RPB10)